MSKPIYSLVIYINGISGTDKDAVTDYVYGELNKTALANYFSIEEVIKE